MKRDQATVISLDAVRGEARRRSEAGSLALQAEPMRATDRRETAKDATRSQWSLAAAITVHACAALALWSGVLDRHPEGGGGQYLESISIDLVPSQVLEARRPSRPDDISGGRVAELANADGQREHPAEKRVHQEAEKSHIKTEEVQKKSADSAPIAPKPVKQPETKETDQARGAVVTAVVNSPGTSAPGAAASPGEISRYAVRVREALARHRPRGLKHKGTTTIAFALDKSGKLVSARITESSGDSAIDEAVLAAVRRTIFPSPPPTMTDRQLSYVVPFHFK